MIAHVVAGLIVPLRAYYPFSPPMPLLIAYENIRLLISRFSPVTLFTEVAGILLNPRIRSLGPIYILSPDLPIPEPLSIDESIILAWPHISALLAGFTVCFTLCYIAFMRQEIKPTWA
jgi:ABC-2 type transport system permease protein